MPIVVPAALDAGVLWSLKIPAATEVVLIDAPAGVHGPQLGSLLRRCDTLIVPVLPSRIDWRATSAFLDELKRMPELRGHDLRIGVLANRVRERTVAARELRDNLDVLGLPYLGAIRDTQAYVLAAALGKSIFDFDTPSVREHHEDWDTVLAWLGGTRAPVQAAAQATAVSC
jgi:chromosome partitioning protein